jgi:hypothetical protein
MKKLAKLTMDAHQLQMLYPPMSGSVEKALEQTLSSLVDGKERPIMARKLSFGLLLAVILLLVTVSAAIALTQSNLLQHLFGGGQQIPNGVEETLRQVEQTVGAGDISVTLNEYVFDGEKLHLRWSVNNTSGHQMMITMSPFLVNGKDINVEHETPFQTDDHTWAYVLGGEADGVAMPGSVSNYTTFENAQDMDGNRPFVSGGTAVITGTVYVWEVLNPPVLVNMSTMDEYEDYEKVAKLRRLPVDKNGFCDLEYFAITDQEDIGTFSAEESKKAFEYLGWAKMSSELPIQFTIPLDTQSIRQLEPTQTTFETDGFTLEITHMAYRQTGGTIEVKIYRKPGGPNINSLDLVVLDADTLAFLNGGRTYTTGSDQVDDMGYVLGSISLEPVAGEMPTALIIAPSVLKSGWDWEAPHDTKYDRHYTYDLNGAVRVDLR